MLYYLRLYTDIWCVSVDTWGHPQREQISTGCPTSGDRQQAPTPSAHSDGPTDRILLRLGSASHRLHTCGALRLYYCTATATGLRELLVPLALRPDCPGTRNTWAVAVTSGNS